MSSRRRPDHERRIADQARQIAELRERVESLTTVALDQQGRIRALSLANAYLIKAEADRTGSPDAMLAAVRGVFALFGAALAALHGPGAAASNAGSGLQLEEMLRLAEHWNKIGPAQGTPAEKAPADARAEPAEPPASNVVPLAAGGGGAAQGRETS